MDWAEIRTLVQGIQGYINDSEAEYLYVLAKKCGGTIVEIGSWKGKSTVCLALGSRAGVGGKVFAIDPHEGIGDTNVIVLNPESTEQAFRDNIKQAGVDDIVMPFVMNSDEAVKGWIEPISLLWIDGAHDYESVKKDFLLWEPYLKEGGIIVIHDAIHLVYPGIRKVIHDHIFYSKKFIEIGLLTKCNSSILCARKTKKICLLDNWRKVKKLLQWYFHIRPLGYYIIITILTKIGLLAPVRMARDKVLTLICNRNTIRK